MNLSNKILIGFFGFIFLYLTATFAEIRFKGTPNIVDKSNSIAETVELQGISYLIVNNHDREVKVIASDSAQLEVRSFTGDLLKSLKYTISGDTLTLSGLESETARISVFVPASGLKAISVNSSPVGITGFQQERLHISGDAGRFWMSDSKVVTLVTDLKNKSYVEINTSELDTVSVKMESSQMYLSSPIQFVHGSINDRSFLQLNDTEDIQLKKDRNSDLKIY